jgi:hypothetical protein
MIKLANKKCPAQKNQKHQFLHNLEGRDKALFNCFNMLQTPTHRPGLRRDDGNVGKMIPTKREPLRLLKCCFKINW